MEYALPLWIDAPWMAMGLVWAAAALWTKRTVRAEPLDSRYGHILTFAAAFALLFSRKLQIGPLGWHVPSSDIATAIGLALTVSGIGFAIWARVYLGGNWSAVVAIKRGHTLVRTGPYAIVRHPIYAGLLLAMLGTAIELGALAGIVGVIVAFAAWLAKARLEESFLLAQFGAEYVRYQQQVKALIPFVM